MTRASRGCQDVSVYQQRLTLWIIGTVLLCAALGALLGHHIGDGGPGNVALLSASCAVLGSFVPGTAARLRCRLRGRNRPHQGPA
jgi:uncharacterized protein YcfJ